MKNELLGIAATALILTGCASTQEPRLYTLHTLEATPLVTPSKTDAPTVFIAPVHLPGQLDHSSIITQVNENEIAFSDFHRWAEPLEGNFRHTLARNLGLQLESALLFAEGRKSPDTTDFRVEVWVSYLSGVLGETARLEARWSIRSSTDNQLIAMETFQKEVPLADASHRTYVHAQSELLAELCREIAAAVPKR
jgi:uncharacterized lipoprotein YmbA